MQSAEWRARGCAAIGHSSAGRTRSGDERAMGQDEQRSRRRPTQDSYRLAAAVSPGSSGGKRGRLLAGPDDLLATGPDPDQHDRHADEVGDETQVVARRDRQVARAARGADVLAPAGKLRVLADRVMQDGLVVRKGVERRLLLAAIARAHLDALEAAEDVELGDDERRERVDACRVLQRDEVEPARPARAARRGAELTAALADLRAHLVVELGRERARADARGVRLRD